MKRNYQRLKISALPSVSAKIFFACWMLFLATPSVSSSQDLVFKNPGLVPGSASVIYSLAKESPAPDGKADSLKNDVEIVFLTVKLTSFTAKGLDKNKVVLNWNTAQEQNFSHFTIERSLDGNEFSDAGIIFSIDDSKHTRSYSFTDKLKTKETGIVYYRLKMVDVDGKSQLSPIKIVKLREEKANAATDPVHSVTGGIVKRLATDDASRSYGTPVNLLSLPFANII